MMQLLVKTIFEMIQTSINVSWRETFGEKKMNLKVEKKNFHPSQF